MTKIRNLPAWRSILNIAGFALITGFGASLADRTLALEIVPLRLVPVLEDLSTVLVTLAILLFTVLTAFTEHDEVKGEVAWIERTTWPFMAGWTMGCLYLVLIMLSSPINPLRILSLR